MGLAMGASLSDAAQLVSIGICVYIAGLHVALARSREPGHGWVAGWSAVALAFQATRLVQLHAADPGVAVAAARLYAACSPLLVWSLVGFARALRGSPATSRGMLAYTVGTLLLAACMGATDWFVTSGVEPKHDWFGRVYLGVQSTHGVLVLVPVIAGGLAHAARLLWRTDGLTRGDRLVMIGALAVYAGMGVFSLASAVDLVPLPGMAEFGPVVVCVGLNQLLVRRHVRLALDLGREVAERTRELEVANRRLGEETAHYRALFDHVPSSVAVWAADGRLLDMNHGAQALMRAGPDLTGVNAYETEPMVASGAADLIRRVAETGLQIHTELSIQTGVGEFRLLVSTIPLRRGPDGQVEAVMQIGEDVGERRALEERLRQSQKLDALGRLAAGIAHEINNPLAYVRSNLTQLQGQWAHLVDELRKGEGPELEAMLADSEEALEESTAGVERVIAIVRDMKSYAHGSAVEAQACELAALCGDAARIAAVDRSPDVRIEARHEPGLPAVRCQPNRIQQVLVNLLSNALDAVAAGGLVEVSTRREGSRVVVSVRDDGCGIEPEVLERIFEPFFTTKPAGQGTGLGLHVARDIVRGHGGDLRVLSRPGVGTRFELWLPIDPGDDLGPADAAGLEPDPVTPPELEPEPDGGAPAR